MFAEIERFFVRISWHFIFAAELVDQLFACWAAFSPRKVYAKIIQGPLDCVMG